jgi:Ca2+-binding EF-hand superfamily protein
MRLGLSSGAPAKPNPGFSFAADSKNNLVAFEKPSPRKVAELHALASTGRTNAGSAAAAADAGAPETSGTEPFVPPRLALAGLKLTFRGFFTEAVPESPVESARRRYLVLQYYLENDTVEVMEPGVRNDGISHGKFLKRMPIAGVSVDTLRVGSSVEIFGRVIHLIACDEFTRTYYSEAGINRPQAADESVDKDAWTKTQEAAFARNDPNAFHGVKSSAITRFIEAVNGSSRTASFKKDVKGRFLEYDNLVLRFLVVWDSRKYGIGEKNLFWLSYYLATELTEIKETKGKKSIAGWPTLLRKTRLPKFIMAHDDRMRSAEDVTGDEDYYTEDDFIVGKTINVFGREMLIADCEKATAAWYLANKGIDQRANKVDVGEPVPEPQEIKVPPHMGIGSEEDTLESWKHLIPRKKPVDLAKLRSATGKTRKFLCKLISSDPINAERVFRITVYLDDNDVSVFEPPIRNSGVKGGVFQKKMRTKNVATGTYFTIGDFVPGIVVTIKGHRFNIFEEERQPEEAIADVNAIIKTLKSKLLDASASLRKMFRKFDLDKSQTMSFEEFVNMLGYYSLGLTKYEAIVLFKAFEDKPGFMSYNNFMHAFSAAEDSVKSTSGGSGGVGDAAEGMKDRYTIDDLEQLIAEAKQCARDEEAKADQEVLLARLARSFKNAKTASEVHNNFRRFGASSSFHSPTILHSRELPRSHFPLSCFSPPSLPPSQTSTRTTSSRRASSATSWATAASTSPPRRSSSSSTSSTMAASSSSTTRSSWASSTVRPLARSKRRPSSGARHTPSPALPASPHPRPPFHFPSFFPRRVRRQGHPLLNRRRDESIVGGCVCLYLGAERGWEWVTSEVQL